MKYIRILSIKLTTSLITGFFLLIQSIIPLSQPAFAQTGTVSLSIAPATQTVAANSQVTLSVNISNPTSMSITAADLTIGTSHTYIATKTGYNTVSSSTVLDTSSKNVPINMTSTTPPAAGGGGAMAIAAIAAIGIVYFMMKKPPIPK